MKFSKVLACAILSFGSCFAFAQSMNCQGLGELLDNGDMLLVTYEAGNQLRTDTASFESMSATESVYVANKSGARITISNALLEGKVPQGQILVNVNGSERAIFCQAD